MRKALAVLGSTLIASCSCARGEERVEIDPPRSVPEIEATAAPAGAWGIARLRRCSSWRYAETAVTERHVYGCPDAVHDLADGALVAIEGGGGAPLAAIGDRSIWSLEERGLLVRDGAHAVRGPIDVGGHAWSAGPGRAGSVVVSTGEAVREIDLASGAVHDLGERCARAAAIRVIDGEVACVIADDDRGAMRVLSAGGERGLEWLHGVRLEESGRVIGRGESGLVVVERGEPRTIAIEGIEELLDVRGERALIARASSVELVDLIGGATELVLGERAHGGAIVGDRIVLVTDRGDLVWMQRGARLEAPSIPVRVPEGFEPLDALDDGEWPAWGVGESRWERDRTDVAAFDGTGEDLAHVVVSWIDRAEVTRFEGDDVAWARALMSRYVERGTDRTAHVYRDATGARVMRGHTYIGGCERTHVDVRVRELDGALELWTMQTGDRTGVDEVLGAIPARARAIDDGWRDGYAGDPSVGAIAE